LFHVEEELLYQKVNREGKFARAGEGRSFRIGFDMELSMDTRSERIVEISYNSIEDIYIIQS
jgi:hypothetical protein